MARGGAPRADRPGAAAACAARRCVSLYETIDAIWYAAGDNATDFSFYTKRLTLAAIYGATVLYWLDDRSEGFADTRAFIDRRLAGAARIGRVRRDFETLAERLPNPFRLFRPLH